ncbi:MAG: radical SAM/SPASM family putative metalloenzyme maturase [Chloroflexota bacterium]
MAGTNEHLKALSNRPSKLFVETTTRCNLRCPICLKQSGNDNRAEGDLSLDLFSRLEAAFPALDALILNGIGEPTLHPNLETFIRRARALMPAGGLIGFQSNGVFINERRASSLINAGLDRICLSVEACSKELFETLRLGGEADVISRALSSLQSAKKKTGRMEVQVGIEFVCTRSNIDELPSVLQWAAGLGATFAIVSQLLPYNPITVGEATYDTNTSSALDFLQSWLQRARRTRLDLRRYPDLFMKPKRSSPEEEVVALVREMVADAYNKGVSLHVDRLLRRDADYLEHVSQVFSESSEVAKDGGLALELPEVVPRGQRRCDFVEEGSAFISWDGKIHPCYFLWHQGRCYLGGCAKNVEPVVFGSVADEDLQSVWNVSAFRSFREEVIRYDFPFCFDCNFALCDLVQTGHFEQDCHIGTVPCGACMWCTGLFNCMR